MGLISSFVTFEVGVRVVDEIFLSEEAEAERDIELYQSFVDFVEQNDVASTDTKKFDEWISQYDDSVYLTVYREDKVFLKDFEISGDEVNNITKAKKTIENDFLLFISIFEHSLHWCLPP